MLVTAGGISCTNPHAHTLAEGAQSASAGRRKSRALRDRTINLLEKMNEVIQLTRASSSICLWPYQGRLSAVSVGPQESQKVLHLCSHGLALPEQVSVVGLDAVEAQGHALATQPGLCVETVPSEASRAAQIDLTFK